MIIVPEKYLKTLKWEKIEWSLFQNILKIKLKKEAEEFKTKANEIMNPDEKFVVVPILVSLAIIFLHKFVSVYQ